MATPLPHPPTGDPERVEVQQAGEGMVNVIGAAGAIDPGDTDLRLTSEPGPTSVGTPVSIPGRAEADGSFTFRVRGLVNDRFAIEAITEDNDLFLFAVTRNLTLDRTEVVELDDRDDDGSPTLVDCAPDDPTVWGQRCD